MLTLGVGQARFAVEAVIFDKDGTLIDLAASWSPAGRAFIEIVTRRDEVLMRRLGTAIGVEDGEIVPDGVMASGTLADLVEVTRSTLGSLGASPSPELLERAVGVATQVAADIVVPIGDVSQVIAGLRVAGLGIGITTSDDRQPTLTTLEQLGLAELVDVVVAGDDGFPPKPAPDPLLEATRSLGVSPSAALYVGDSAVDLAAGRAAGFAGVVVVGEGRAGSEADAVIASIEELEVMR